MKLIFRMKIPLKTSFHSFGIIPFLFSLQNQDSLHIAQQGNPVSTASSSTLSSSQAPPSTYQITINGQPAFILPDIVPPQSSVDENSAIIGGISKCFLFI